MAIDTSQPLSPGWWLHRLAARLVERQKHLDKLDDYLRGDPPLPTSVQHAEPIYREFMHKARSNFADLVVEAVRERMQIRGFRTAVDGDDSGDDTALAVWSSNGMDIEAADVHAMMLGLGVGYAIVGMPDGAATPVITAEDPRQVITEHDPARRQKVIAALKLFHDDVANRDVAYLYLPGVVYTAARQRRQARPTGLPSISFAASSWGWLDTDMAFVESDDASLVARPLPGAHLADVVPVVEFANKRHMSEFEPHIDVLDRINHVILERMTIAAFQAFKQRAVIGDLPDTDENGKEIDWDTVLAADPGALWTLPEGASLWESGAVDLAQILASIKSDVEHLSALTRTPMYYLTPGETAQSAEGASLAREGLVFKAEDRMTRAGAGWAQVMRLAFLFTGDQVRADITRLQPLWRPAERFSLSERASASAQAVTALPWETIMEQVWQLSPQELARAKTQRSADLVIAQQKAMLAAAAAPPPPPQARADTTLLPSGPGEEIPGGSVG